MASTSALTLWGSPRSSSLGLLDVFDCMIFVGVATSAIRCEGLRMRVGFFDLVGPVILELDGLEAMVGRFFLHGSASAFVIALPEFLVWFGWLGRCAFAFGSDGGEGSPWMGRGTL